MSCEAPTEHRHRLHPDGRRFPVPDGGDGLVQPVRAELGLVADYGDRLLSAGTRSALAPGSARVLQ